MRLKIVIPTLNRLEKLRRCIDSINKAKKGYDVDVHIAFSDEKELEIIKKEYDVNCSLVKEYRVPNFWNSFLKELKKDECLMYINDDVELDKDAIKYTFELFPKFFSDFDGVLGIKQQNIPEEHALPTAFGVIGYKFVERFPDKDPFCWDYNRFFADRELYLYSTKVNKFQYTNLVKLTHYHPAFYKDLVDTTHKKVREYWRQDFITYNIRQKKGYLWGVNFYLETIK